MSAITTLVENTIIDDLLQDSALSGYAIAPHDANYAKASNQNLNPDSTIAITVTAFDWGDWPGTYGAGIRNVKVEVQVLANVAEINYDTKLDDIVDRISQRLQPATTLFGVQNRDFSTNALKVYGIYDAQIKDERHDLEKGAVRERVIERSFVAAQIA